MRKKIKLLTLFLACCSIVKGQVDLQNTGTLYISSGTDTLSINGNFNNTSSGAFTNNGWFYLKQNFTNSQAAMATGTGTLYLNGTGAQAITSTAGSAFHNLTVNKVSALVTMAADGTVNNTLRLTSGKISLGNNNLTIGNAGSIMEASATNYIIAEANGSLIQQVNNNTTKTFPVGLSSNYIPASIGLSPGSVTDNFSVKVRDEVYSQGTTGNIIFQKAVNATWVITEATAGGSDASVTLQWPASLEMYLFLRDFSRLADFNSGTWNYGSSDIPASGTNPYTVIRSGFNDFSLFAISSSEALPVTWLSIRGKNENQNNYIYWSTAAEKNNSHFIVEVSPNGNDFTEIGHVPANVNPSAIREYSFVHYNVSPGVNYYRIRQVDIDNRYSYSKTIKISSIGSGTNKMVVLMNPVKYELALSIQLNRQITGSLLIKDASGRIVFKQKASLRKGSNILEIRSFILPAGVYWITLTDENTLKLTAGFVKQ